MFVCLLWGGRLSRLNLTINDVSPDQRLDEDRIAHQAAETSRQEALLKLVSQTLDNNTQKLLEQTIRNEMQTSVIPSLGKTVTAAVEKQLGKGVVETMNKVGISGLGLFGMV